MHPVPNRQNELTPGEESDTRETIIAAAREAYSRYGFRGATTRRIAEAAGVNEVTIFRHFGSKQALLGDALRAPPSGESSPGLPKIPRDPTAELVTWSESQLAHLRDRRSMIRTCMGEIEERPELAGWAAGPPRAAFTELCDYLLRVRDAGMSLDDFDERAAASTLLGAMLSDAMGREMMPEIYPPLKEAPRQYAELILRAIGADETSRSAFSDATGAPRG